MFRVVINCLGFTGGGLCSAFLNGELIYPDTAEFIEWAKQNNIPFKDFVDDEDGFTDRVYSLTSDQHNAFLTVFTPNVLDFCI